MSAKTTISWTDRTWNPVRGCSRVSPGCDSCYAMRQAHRFAGPGQPYEGLTVLRPNSAKRPGVDWSGRVRLVPEALSEPLSWRKPQRIFVNSMSDLFHEQLPNEQILRVFATMALCQHHTFQVLTKRAARARRWFDDVDLFRIGEQMRALDLPANGRSYPRTCDVWPLPNVWLGASIEDRAAKYRIDELRELPAVVRFLSCEPLLEDLGELDLRGISWVIVGGESGPGARPCALEWIERIVEQCRAARVAVFVKQIGAFVVSEQRAYLRSDDLELGTDEEAKAAGFNSRWLWRAGLSDRKGGDIAEFPDELQVREFPEPSR